jgi:hypothetical protein
MGANAREFRPLSDIGLLPASREAAKEEHVEHRGAEVAQLLPHGHPPRLRIVSPDEVAAALDPKPPAPSSESGEH